MVSTHHSSNADTMSLQIVHNVQCTCKPAQIANNLQYWSITYDCKSSQYAQAHLILMLLCHHNSINWQYLYISRQNLRQIFATIVVSWMKCSFGCLLLNMCPNIQISVVRRHFFLENRRKNIAWYVCNVQHTVDAERLLNNQVILSITIIPSNTTNHYFDVISNI